MLRPLLIAWMLIPLLAHAQQGKLSKARRVALVIGNSEYTGLAKLPAVPKDVALISDALSKVGFEVHKYENFKVRDFIAAFRTEAPKLVSPGDVCVIYYAGYAVQGEDDNYLLPVDFDPQDGRELQARSLHYKILQNALRDIG